MRDNAGPAGTVIRGLAPLFAMLLAGCQVSDPPRIDGAGTTAPVLAAPPEATRPAPPPIPAAQALFSFESLLGVPTTKADVLARGIGAFARERNVTLVRRGDPTATYRVVGFLSAVGGTGETAVNYVWDVFDTSGNRVHRITGTEMAGEADADPWSGVGEAALQAIAARTVEGLHAWLNQSPAGGAPPSPAAAAPPPTEAI